MIRMHLIDQPNELEQSIHGNIKKNLICNEDEAKNLNAQ